MPQIDAVTGAFGYTGRFITRRLLDAGHTVRTLTNHPRPSAEIDVHPLAFDDPDALARSLANVTTLYNTYWVRYQPGGTTYEQGVANTLRLLEAATRAGVDRVVHISITKPSHDSFYAYYRGKVAVEDAIHAGRLPYAIVRPTVLFGENDILINNIAWLARRFPVFAIPGDGQYRLRPVATADIADLCVRLGQARDNVTVDAVGPESYTFKDLVRLIANTVGATCRLIHLPPALVTPLLRGIGAITRDVTLTRDEIDGLMAELVHVDGETTCPTALSRYLADHRATVGRRYQSELARRRGGDRSR